MGIHDIQGVTVKHVEMSALRAEKWECLVKIHAKLGLDHLIA